MTALVLELAVAPILELELVGPDGSLTALAQQDPKSVVAVVGAPGRDGGAKTVVAAEALGGHRAVTVDGYHATTATLDKFGGITRGAGVIGAAVEVVDRGLMVEPSWAWAVGPVFITGAGVLTQAAPVGLARRIAWAISPTQINIDPFPIIQLA